MVVHLTSFRYMFPSKQAQHTRLRSIEAGGRCPKPRQPRTKAPQREVLIEGARLRLLPQLRVPVSGLAPHRPAGPQLADTRGGRFDDDAPAQGQKLNSGGSIKQRGTFLMAAVIRVV